MKNRQPYFSISIFILGLLLFLRIVGVVSLSITEIAAYILLFYGTANVFTTFGSQRKGLLFFSSLMFFVGTVIYVVNNYEILSPFKIFYPALLFILSGSFLILFIDNLTQYVFLLVSILFGTVGYISIVFYNSMELFLFANRITVLVLQFWPVFLIFIGVGILVNRNNVESSSSGD